MAPYGSFVVDLHDFIEAEELQLEVRLVDELGLQARSSPQTIQLDIFQPANPPIRMPGMPITGYGWVCLVWQA